MVCVRSRYSSVLPGHQDLDILLHSTFKQNMFNIKSLRGNELQPRYIDPISNS